MASIYLGAKAVRLHLENPDYVHQSAHSIRELIENLPNSFDLPTVRHPSLTERVKGLIESWNADGKAQSDGTANSSRDTFDGVMHEFAIEFDVVSRTFRERSRQLVAVMDVSNRTLPPDLVQRHASQWGSFRHFFVELCHHRIEASEGEFDEKVDEFELFLLGKLRPPAVRDQATLRSIIEKGEGDA
jgi:hypothetical protein